MRTTILSAVAALALVCAAANAATHPNDARGLNPSGSKSFGLDTVNLFNGGLTLAIPLGPAVPVNGGFSYALTLVYNSQVWEHNVYVDGDEITRDQSLPDRANNAGLGWRVSLGRYDLPPYPDGVVYDPIADNTRLVQYDAADGSRHLFYKRLHETDNNETSGVRYTRDGSYLRFNASQVQFPDGTKHTVGSQGFPTRLSDAFGNGVNVEYLTLAGAPAATQVAALRWRIRDPAPANSSRKTEVWFRETESPYQANQPLLVDRVEVSGVGGTMVYQFRYNIDDPGPAVVVTGCHNSDSNTANRSVVFLTKVTLPDGTTYEMPLSSYHTTTAPPGPCTTGLMKDVKLPTGGKVAWDWGLYGFNIASSPRAFRQVSTGVTARRLYNESGSQVPGQWLISPTNPTPLQRITTVTDPNSTIWRHYFSMCPGSCSPDAEHAFEYGLPLTRATTPAPASASPRDGAGRFLSLEVVEAGATVRTLYVKYEHDPSTIGTIADNVQYMTRLNQRLAGQRVLYGPPQEAATPTADFADDTFTDFDGLGHYRVRTTGGNFPGPDSQAVNNNAKTWTVNYNPENFTYPGSFVPWPVPSSWMLQRHTFSKAEEGTLTQIPYQTVCIDPATGFLRGRRTHVNSGPAYSANDVVEIFEQSSGNLSRESYLGADGGGLPVDAVNGAICKIADNLVISPGSLPTPSYQLNHGYTQGMRSSSTYTGFAGFKVLDRTIDPATGLTSSERDSAGRETVYTYDPSSGRLTNVAPAGESAVDYTYRNPSGSDLLRVTTSKGSTADPPGPITRETFDAFGRSTLSETRLPSTSETFSSRTTLYNTVGWKRYTSERGTIGDGTTIVAFDPFGRPRTIHPADGNTHAVTISYAGDREVTKTTKVWTGGPSETNAVTVEVYDRYGRLFRVTEPNGTVTQYGYDAADRLTKVCHNRNPNNGTCGQQRSFNYDNRGFLLSEQHPEASLVYGLYDARGRAGSKHDGTHALTFTYDAAERLTEVKAGSQVLKSFTYASANGTGDWQQVRTAARTNVTSLGLATVTETNVYQGVRGRLSQRDTAVSTGQSFTQGFGYDVNGQLATITYPRCTHGACTQPPPAVFADVPVGHAHQREVEALYRVGVTTGCLQNPLRYCPDNNLTRAEMAVFLVRAGSPPGSADPPRCLSGQPIFADVPCDFWAGPWIEEIYRRGITVGCGTNPLTFCPNQTMPNWQLAIFLLRSREGALYQPPTCAAAPYNDVPCTEAGAEWIAEVKRRGWMPGCGGNNFCPHGFPTRAAMAGHLDRAFDFPIALDPNTPRTVALCHKHGFLTKVTNNCTTPTNTYGSFTYHPNLTVSQVARNNGTTDAQGMDTSFLPRPSSLGASGPYAGWSSGAYAYDGTGNVKTIGSSSFVYDSLSRITSATVYTDSSGGTTGGALTKTFGYDVYGNLTSGAGPVNPPIDPATNRLASPNQYDGAGNLTLWNGVAYQYDAFNQMTRMTNGTAEDHLYVYNASDERVWAYDLLRNASRWSLRGLDSLTLREYLDYNGWSLSNDYFYRDGQLLAAETQAGQRHFHLDHLGSPRLITRGSGYRAAYHTYYPFGMEATGETQDSMKMKFAGHERDLANPGTSNDDLDYMHARHYNPGIGRFLSVDLLGASPREPQTWNRYSYVTGNPLKYWDPDGWGRAGAVIDMTKAGWRAVKRHMARNELLAAQREGEDIVAGSYSMGHDIAKKAGGGRSPIHELGTGPGDQRPHFHPADRSGGHIFYRVAGALTASYWAEGRGSALEFAAAGVDIVSPLAAAQDFVDVMEIWNETTRTFFVGIEVNPGISPHPRSGPPLPYGTVTVPAGAYMYGLSAHGYHFGDFMTPADLFLAGTACVEGICL